GRPVGLDRPRAHQEPPRLPADEVAWIGDWIDKGASGPDSMEPIVAAKPVKHWAYVKPVRPEIPKVKNAAWCRNPADYFVLAQLEEKGIAPSPEADKETLLRRLSLDLIGLPPTLQDVDAFLADQSPNAYDAVV